MLLLRAVATLNMLRDFCSRVRLAAIGFDNMNGVWR